MCRFAGVDDLVSKGGCRNNLTAPDDLNVDLQLTSSPAPNLVVPALETHHGIDAKLKESLKSQLYLDKIDERLTSMAADLGTICC